MTVNGPRRTAARKLVSMDVSMVFAQMALACATQGGVVSLVTLSNVQTSAQAMGVVLKLFAYATPPGVAMTAL